MSICLMTNFSAPVDTCESLFELSTLEENSICRKGLLIVIRIVYSEIQCYQRCIKLQFKLHTTFVHEHVVTA